MNTIILNDNTYVDDILEIEHASFSIPWTKGMFEDEFSKDIACYVGVEDNGKAIAYGGFWKIFDEGHITNIAVAPEFRKKGIGKTVLFAMEEIAKANGIVKMTLEVRKSNIPAITLYKKAGFLTAGERKAYYEDNKEDALIMWKTL